MLLFVHRRNETNVGDINCCPADYFPFPDHERSDILDLPDLSKYKAIILGGGGLFFFGDEIRRMLSSGVPVIGWGIGTNKHDYTVPYYGVDLRQFKMLGLRDRPQGWRFLPCVSCMHPTVSKKYAQQNDVVIYQHRDFPIEMNLPRMDNNSPIEKAIEFIGSANCVVTNSYHGFYWSLLMGKQVMLYRPFSSRFFCSPWILPIIDNEEEIQAKRAGCVIYPNLLASAIEANKAFYKDVLCLL